MKVSYRELGGGRQRTATKIPEQGSSLTLTLSKVTLTDCGDLWSTGVDRIFKTPFL